MGGMILAVKLCDNDEGRGDKIPWGAELRELLIIEVEWQGALSAMSSTASLEIEIPGRDMLRDLYLGRLDPSQRMKMK